MNAMIEILCFGVTREIIGQPTLTIDPGALPENVGELRKFLLERFPKLKEITSLRVAVNNKFAQEQTKLHPDDEVALIPPVSGG